MRLVEKLTPYNVRHISQKLVSIYGNYSEMKRDDSFLDHSVCYTDKLVMIGREN